jgi:[acyl-carrier-protein] S-malonyltransferase
MNYTGKPLRDENEIPLYMSEQLVNPVLWTKSLRQLYDYGVTMTIEQSPKLLTSAFVTQQYPNIKTICYGLKKDRFDFAKLIEADSNFNKDIPNFFGRCLSILASTPNYSDSSENHQRVMESYKEIKKLYLQSKESKKSMREQNHSALHSLLGALNLKQVPEEEIVKSIRILLDETNMLYQFKAEFSKL